MGSSSVLPSHVGVEGGVEEEGREGGVMRCGKREEGERSGTNNQKTNQDRNEDGK